MGARHTSEIVTISLSRYAGRSQGDWAVSRVSVVLPTLNERATIADLILSVLRHVSECQIIVVDDDSSDGTADAVQDLAATFPSILLIRRKTERGLATALRRGLEQATGDVVAWMDADLSMPPALMPRLVQAVEQGADVAVGSRYTTGGRDARREWPLRVSSWVFNTAARLLLRGPVHDYTSSFMAARPSVVARLGLRGHHGEYCVDFLTRATRHGFRVTEVGYVSHSRQSGTSKTAPDVRTFVRHGRRYAAVLLRLAYERWIGGERAKSFSAV